jgi:YVTN family beta-propeller protein
MYDTKSLALYNSAHESLSYARLPEGAKGPIQMYPTPDSRFVYLADQGYYFGQPAGDTVYKIDVTTSQVVASIKAGSAPHGVVVSKDGGRVYVTNLLSGDVSIIDATKDVELSRIPVGKEPNGISVWTKDSGGMP